MSEFPQVIPKEGGPFSLYCKSCGCWVPNTANAEIRKEGYYAYSHTCYNGVCNMKNGERQGEKEKNKGC